MHQGRMTFSHELQSHELHTMPRPEHDENLWNMSIINTSPENNDLRNMPITSTPIAETNIPTLINDPTTPQDDDVVVEDEGDTTTFEDEPRYNLRSHAQSTETEEIVEENEAEEETELQQPIIDFDLEDLQGASLDDALDAIEGRSKPEYIAKWPNDAYRDFMNLIIEGNISNRIGDKIISFFNKYNNLKESPLPKSTKNGKDYINQINSPSINFKEKVIATHSGVDFKLYYRPIFRAIQALVQRPEVADNFVSNGNLKFSQDGGRIFGEPYEGDWWLETEKNLPPLNNLLSIVLYSDATTFDGLGKASGHPVFLTLGNIPNRVRNSSDSKVLLGFLPKVQDSGIKTTEKF
jgi:hypothetical protein